jgi:hypothetical protein
MDLGEAHFENVNRIVKTTAKNDGVNNPCLIFDIEETDEDIVSIGTLQKGPGLTTGINIDHTAILDVLRDGVYTLYVKEDGGKA